MTILRQIKFFLIRIGFIKKRFENDYIYDFIRANEITKFDCLDLLRDIKFLFSNTSVGSKIFDRERTSDELLKMLDNFKVYIDSMSNENVDSVLEKVCNKDYRIYQSVNAVITHIETGNNKFSKFLAKSVFFDELLLAHPRESFKNMSSIPSSYAPIEYIPDDMMVVYAILMYKNILDLARIRFKISQKELFINLR